MEPMGRDDLRLGLKSQKLPRPRRCGTNSLGDTAAPLKSLDAIEGEGSNYSRIKIALRDPNGRPIEGAITYVGLTRKAGIQTPAEYVAPESICRLSLRLVQLNACQSRRDTVPRLFSAAAGTGDPEPRRALRPRP